jgi:Protein CHLORORESPIRATORY REDUCTION 7
LAIINLITQSNVAIAMPDSMMYREDAFVVLESDQPEQFMTPDELLEKLAEILRSRQDDLPRELQKFTTIEDQAMYLRENFCELDMEPGKYLQWYVVRLEK